MSGNFTGSSTPPALAKIYSIVYYYIL